MTTDINGTVVAIQGNAVSSATPTDGYVLVWSAADGYWKPQPQRGMTKTYFSSNGTWIAPAGITGIILIGAGGGGSGAAGSVGSTNFAGGGGGGSTQQATFVSVVPGTTYTITIGVGGAGGSGPGVDGSPTTFSSLATFNGACGGMGQNNAWCGGMPNAGVYNYAPWAASFFPGGYIPNLVVHYGMGGTPARNITSAVQNTIALQSLQGFAGGINGAASSTYQGGGGGGGGPQGIGADGGYGNNAGTGNPGSSAAANTGAGGGGGGGGSSGSGGNGGSGGSGYLYVIY